MLVEQCDHLGEVHQRAAEAVHLVDDHAVDPASFDVGQEGDTGDTMEHAEARLEWVFQKGGTPFAMFYRPADDLRFTIPTAWRSFVRRWNRPACIFATHAGSGGDIMTESAPAQRTGALAGVG